MVAKPRFTWDSRNLQTNLRNAPAKINRAVTQAVDYQASRSEKYMRTNAKWTDRTANARNGLVAVPQHNGGSHSIVLAHSMPYGIWLEVRWSGKYGIIPEAVRTGGSELMGLLTKLFAALGTT